MSHSFLSFRLMSYMYRKWLMITPLPDLYLNFLLVMKRHMWLRPMQNISEDSVFHAWWWLWLPWSWPLMVSSDVSYLMDVICALLNRVKGQELQYPCVCCCFIDILVVNPGDAQVDLPVLVCCSINQIRVHWLDPPPRLSNLGICVRDTWLKLYHVRCWGSRALWR